MSPLRNVERRFPGTGIACTRKVSSRFRSLLFRGDRFQATGKRGKLADHFCSLNGGKGEVSSDALPILRQISGRISFL